MVEFQNWLEFAGTEVPVTIGYNIIDRHYGRPAFPELVSVKLLNGTELIEQLDFQEFDHCEQRCDDHLRHSGYVSEKWVA